MHRTARWLPDPQAASYKTGNQEPSSDSSHSFRPLVHSTYSYFTLSGPFPWWTLLSAQCCSALDSLPGVLSQLQPPELTCQRHWAL